MDALCPAHLRCAPEGAAIDVVGPARTLNRWPVGPARSSGHDSPRTLASHEPLCRHLVQGAVFVSGSIPFVPAPGFVLAANEWLSLHQQGCENPVKKGNSYQSGSTSRIWGTVGTPYAALPPQKRQNPADNYGWSLVCQSRHSAKSGCAETVRSALRYSIC